MDSSTYLTMSDSNTNTNTNTNRSDINNNGRSGPRSRRWQKKPLALGPIPLDEGQKLRYPLIQLSKEKNRVSAARKISRSHVNIPLARDSAGRWQPRLIRIPCSQP